MIFSYFSKGKYDSFIQFVHAIVNPARFLNSFKQSKNLPFYTKRRMNPMPTANVVATTNASTALDTLER